MVREDGFAFDPRNFCRCGMAVVFSTTRAEIHEEDLFAFFDFTKKIQKPLSSGVFNF